MSRLGSGSGRRRPRVLDKKVSAHHVLRAGLRSLVVALDPLLFRPLGQPDCGLRPFPRGACRACGHPRQERGGGLLRRMVRWRVGLQWYAAALGLPIGVTLTAAAINVFLLGAQPTSSAAELGGWSSLIPTFFILLLIPGLGGTWEEPGFRGYALPRLQIGRSTLYAGLILGVLWSFWHLPFFITGFDHWNESVQLIAWTVVFAWLYNNTQGSVLLAMLMHAMSNTIGAALSPRCSLGRNQRIYPGCAEGCGARWR